MTFTTERGCPFPKKIPYTTRAEARTELGRWRKRGNVARVRVYSCGDHWHLGHARPRRKTRTTAA